jgi:two-component system response regulator FimZ (fimbrial Z protein)
MKILVADPQPKVRHALSIWISAQPDWQISGEAGSSDDLLYLVGSLQPDVVILARDLPGLPPCDLVKRLREALPEVVIILLTSGPPEHCRKETLDVDLLVSKMEPPSRMLDAILRASQRNER